MQQKRALQQWTAMYKKLNGHEGLEVDDIILHSVMQFNCWNNRTEKIKAERNRNESITEKEAATELAWKNHITVKFRFIS